MTGRAEITLNSLERIDRSSDGSLLRAACGVVGASDMTDSRSARITSAIAGQVVGSARLAGQSICDRYVRLRKSHGRQQRNPRLSHARSE
jgi:hypothetical protein